VVNDAKVYDTIKHMLDNINCSFRQSYQLIKKQPQITEAEEMLIPLGEQPSSPDPQEQHATSRSPLLEVLGTSKAIAVSFTSLTFSVVVMFLQFVRPTSSPYAHMSGSLPVTLVEAALFQPINSEFCLAYPLERAIFPWEQFAEYFGQPGPLDWMPRSVTCSKMNGPGPPHGHRPSPPPHDEPPMHHRHSRGGGYEPLCDPLKLSNLDADVVSSLAKGIEFNKPNIKNVLLLTLESTRKDIFPLKKDSHVYKTILSTYASSNAIEELDIKLRNLTSIATFLSGESNGFGTDSQIVSDGSWKNEFKDGMGGINVQGAVTQAAYTLKSLLSSHCGVEPLPVDFTEETKGQIYQSCLPQILDAMTVHGRGKHSELSSRTDHSFPEDHRTWPWESAMVQ
jgi:hypothetical protein